MANLRPEPSPIRMETGWSGIIGCVILPGANAGKSKEIEYTVHPNQEIRI